MNEWKTSQDHPDYCVKEIKKGTFTVYIFKPLLDDATRKRREEHLRRVAQEALKSYLYKKEKNI